MSMYSRRLLFDSLKKIERAEMSVIWEGGAAPNIVLAKAQFGRARARAIRVVRSQMLMELAAQVGCQNAR